MAGQILMGVVGRPIGQSAGQFVFNSLFRKLGLDAFYAAVDLADKNVDSFFKNGMPHFAAINVTSPHKEVSFGFCTSLSENAAKIRAVNLVVNDGSGLMGFNYDVEGFDHILSENAIQVEGKKIAILGTGGAARSAVISLRPKHTAEIHFFSRNPDTSFERLSDMGFEESVRSYDRLDSSYDIVVKCTPGSHDLSVYPTGRGVAVDLVYNPPESPFLMRMKASGWRTFNGASMFTGQATRSFEQVFGKSYGSVEGYIESAFAAFRNEVL